MSFSYQWERCDADGASCVDIGGATAATYTLTADDVGSTVRVRVSDGTNTATSEHSGVVLATAPTPTGSPEFGVSTGYPLITPTLNLATYYAAVAAAGFGKVRFDYTGGAGSASDQHVNAARAAGLQVLLMIGGSPSDSASAYASRCAAAASVYKSRVSEWELMNEPNLQAWASGAAYAAVAKAGSDAIRAAQPDALILLGGISNFGTVTQNAVKSPGSWLSSVYTLAAGHAWFDHVNYHPYGAFPGASAAQAFANASGWPVMFDTSPSLYSIMSANGDSAKKIYVTEHGAATSFDVTAQVQADFLDMSIMDWKGRANAGDFYLYSFRDRNTDDTNTSGNIQGYFGIVTSAYAHKTAYDVVVADIAST